MKEIIYELINRAEQLINEQQEIIKELKLMESKVDINERNLFDQLRDDHKQVDIEIVNAQKEKVVNIDKWREKFRTMTDTPKKIY